MKIIITGTPGAGKSTVADLLGRALGQVVIHVTDFVKKERLITGKVRGAYEVDVRALKRRLMKKEGVIESHLLCEFSLPDSVVFVLRCNPKILARRMQKRGYLKDKIRENLECEALDYCSIHAEKHYDKVYDVDTTRRNAGQTAGRILAILKKKGKADRVDFSSYFM